MAEMPPQGAVSVPRGLSQRTHRRLIGALGFVLPIVLYVQSGVFPTAGLPRWSPLESISAYYYTAADGFFIGVIFALSLFLLSYRGYEGVRADGILGAIGGVAAMGVALFPTGAPEGLMAPTWWSSPMRVVHYVSAVVLFTVFILFSTWLFRKSAIPDKRARPLEKQRRDTICLICGVVMIAAILWAGTGILTKGSIYWQETIAIMAFSISWLAKGEAHQPLLRGVRRLRAQRGQ